MMKAPDASKADDSTGWRNVYEHGWAVAPEKKGAADNNLCNSRYYCPYVTVRSDSWQSVPYRVLNRTIHSPCYREKIL